MQHLDQTKGEQVASLLNPVRGYRDEQRRNGVEPIDHAKRNFRAIKEREKLNKERRESMEKRIEPKPFKLKQFQNVESKLTPDSRHETSTGTKHKFLKKGEKSRTKIQGTPPTSTFKEEKPNSARSSTRKLKTKAPVPKASELNNLAPRTRKNFISNNAREASEAKLKGMSKQLAETNKSMELEKHTNFGTVPAYLRKRQEIHRRKEEERKAREEDDTPPGMKVLEESERLRTLETLEKTIKETKDQMSKMPLVLNTPSQKKKYKELEEKLSEQEAAIEIFQKDKVYVYA